MPVDSIEEETDDVTLKRDVNTALSETASLLTQLKHCDEIHICGSEVTHQGLQLLAANWGRCRCADFGNSSRFDDADLGQVVENWPNLEEIILSGTAVSDRGILALAKLTRLSVLSLEGAQRVSIDGASKVIEHCRALKCLGVSADWLDDESFQRFQHLAEEHGIDVIAVSGTE